VGLKGASSGLTVVEFFDIRVKELKRLITQYIGVSSIYEWHRPIGLQAPWAVNFPCIQIQPQRWEPSLETNAKFDFWGQVILYVYCTNQQPEGAGTQCMNFASTLEKMLSNNALDDLQTAGRTNRYYVHDGFWIESNLSAMEFSPPIHLGRDEGGERFAVGGRAVFRFHDVLIH